MGVKQSKTKHPSWVAHYNKKDHTLNCGNYQKSYYRLDEIGS